MIKTSDTLSEFIRHVGEYGKDRTSSHLGLIHTRRIYEIVRDNEGVIERNTAMQSEDTVLKDFAASLPETYSLVDLRRKDVSSGINLEYAVDIRKHSKELLWGVLYKRRKKS